VFFQIGHFTQFLRESGTAYLTGKVSLIPARNVDDNSTTTDTSPLCYRTASDFSARCLMECPFVRAGES
jgi:hypothetical protein